MEIKRIGNYHHVDEHGYLINHSNLQANQPHWLKVIEAVKDIYLDRWGQGIHSIYIRGSLAKGIAVDDVSDIDSFAVLGPEELEPEVHLYYETIKAWAEMSEKKLIAQYPFTTGLEVGFESFEGIKDRNNLFNFTLKVESVCIYGEDLGKQIKPYKLGHSIAFQTRYIHLHLQQFLSEYPSETEGEKKLWLNWLMRRFLRLGMQFVMEKERLYTRDLYLCYESFAKYYPEQAEHMYHALELAVNPQTDAETLIFVQNFGDWLVSEASAKLRFWGYTKNNEQHWVIAT